MKAIFRHVRTSVLHVGCALAALAICGLLSRVVRAASGSGESIEQRRARVRSMGATEFERLRRNFEKFQALPEEERERLRRLYREIEHDPQRDRLRQAMESYHRWLQTISPPERNEVLEAEPAERIARLKRVLNRGQRDRRRRRGLRKGRDDHGHVAPLTQRDLDGFFEWLVLWAEPRMTDRERRQLERAPEPKAYLTWYAARQGIFRNLDRVSRDEMHDLTARFRPAVRERLDADGPPGRRRGRLARMLRYSLARLPVVRSLGRDFDRAAPGSLLQVLDRLSHKEQEWVLGLESAVRVRRELHVLRFLEDPPEKFPRTPTSERSGSKPRRRRHGGWRPPRPDSAS